MIKRVKRIVLFIICILTVTVSLPIGTYEVQAESSYTFTAISQNEFNGAAITNTGDLYCWGYNAYGQVGNGSTTNQTTPVKVLSSVASVSVGQYHSAAITSTGDLYCWGYNWYWQVGNGATKNQTTPVKVLSNVASVSLGQYHSAAITKTGDLYCWGYNTYGQVGNGSTASQTTPVKVLSNVASVSLGQYHSAAITTSGDLYCWGNNTYGQVGNESTKNQTTPVKILSNVASVSLGESYSAAVTTSGDLYCWGSNAYGQVGNGSTTDQTTPVKVFSSVKSVLLGKYHSMAITTSGNLYCWGSNDFGQVGNGSTASQTTPVKVLSSVASVSLGELHSAAITTSGDLYCWGCNTYGQIGNGSTVNKTTPVKILSNVSAVSLGKYHSTATTTADSLYCWGDNEYGQVGNGSTSVQTSPVNITDYIFNIPPTASISSTNKVATSQTVTLSMSDSSGIAGYYWGTNKKYSSNTYNSVSSASSSVKVTKTISSSGTYYLVVKDKNGNVSSTYSVTFYKTTLNANGGSVSPGYIITKSGNSFKLPTPSSSRYIFNGWSTSSSASSGNVTTVKPTGNKTYYATWEKNSQVVSAKSLKKVYGSKAFSIGAKTSGDGTLSYKSSNKKVAAVSSKGKVTIVGCGITTITIKASETKYYKSATKKITITIVPKKVTLSSVTSPKKKTLVVQWKKDNSATGYQVYLSTSKNFKKGTYRKNFPKSTTKIKVNGLTRKKTYYVKVRAYKTMDNKKYYGAWSTVKKIKIK